MKHPFEQNPATSEIVADPDHAGNPTTETLFPKDLMADDVVLVNRFTFQSESAHKWFLEWEKLRLAYNLVLLVMVLGTCACIVGWSSFVDPEFWLYLGVSAFLANVCFCVGPWIEGWLAVMGADRKMVRRLVFFFGLLAGCLVTVGAIIFWPLQGMN